MAVLAFQYGMRQYNCEPDNFDFWCRVFEDSSFVRKIGNEGQIISYYVGAQNSLENRNCFLTKFRNYSVLAANKSHSSSLFFETHPEYNNVDILMAFSWNGKSWKFSLYTLKENIDVSKICQEFGGGGHKKAAGMFLEKLPNEISETIFGNHNINSKNVGGGNDFS
jgi:oligoribonuclease NrnB/cAMP/cGMP phosphodiesterase (DHH superfamily)